MQCLGVQVSKPMQGSVGSVCVDPVATGHAVGVTPCNLSSVSASAGMRSWSILILGWSRMQSW